MSINDKSKEKGEMEDKIYIKTADVLRIVKVAGFIAAAFLFPKAVSTLAKEGIIEKILYPEENNKETVKKPKRNIRLNRLRATIKRLKKQKDIELIEENDKQILKLTEKGKIKLLKYDLKNLKLKKPEKWDKKWRLIIYDVPKNKNSVRELFRRYLRGMNFLKLQASVYLTPYPCEEEIEFLRNYYGIINEVIVLTVSSIEQEEAYKNYFKLQ